MTYPKLIKYFLHKYWKGDKHIFGWYYKQWYMKKIAKPLKLKSYQNWKRKKNRKSKKYRTWNAEGKRKAIKDKKCFVCRKEFKLDEHITLEHKIPKSKLKERKLYDNPQNLALSHYKCNQLKADLTLSSPSKEEDK